MSLPLPNLDDRTFADLMEELRARIPSLCPEWTDHNPSDPGITLLELFAWLTEMLLYRINRVPEETVRTFLDLLRPPDWTHDGDLDLGVRSLVQDLRSPYRAVTAADYEALALAVPGVARTRCVPRRNLEEGTGAKPGWVSLIVVPQPDHADPQHPSPPGPPRPDGTLLGAAREYLEPRRLLTVRHAVVAPLYAPVAVEARYALRPGARPEEVNPAAERAIRAFLDPYAGGPEGQGWPFGRDVHLSEIHQVLEAVPGLDFVGSVDLTSDADVTGAGFEQVAQILRDGKPVGLRLGSHLLPWITRLALQETEED
jgi:baseplate J-like protein